VSESNAVSECKLSSINSIEFEAAYEGINCVTIDQLCVSYGKQCVVENVSLEIKRNAVTAILGPSGCGKTTFLHSLNGLANLVPGCSVSGCINFTLQEPQMSDHHLGRCVGMLFQRPNLFPFSIRKNLEFPLRHHGIKNQKDIDLRITQALQDVALWDEVKNRLNDPALGLSGGQQQRLCLARALVLQPFVLLMDEPCSSLDPISSRKIENLIVKLAEQYSVIMVTHDPAQAKRIADFVALFWRNDEGRGYLLEYGATADVLNNSTNPIVQEYFGLTIDRSRNEVHA
jgi:phosphate transport system ATP-binding protein